MTRMERSLTDAGVYRLDFRDRTFVRKFTLLGQGAAGSSALTFLGRFNFNPDENRYRPPMDPSGLDTAHIIINPNNPKKYALLDTVVVYDQPASEQDTVKLYLLMKKIIQPDTVSYLLRAFLQNGPDGGFTIGVPKSPSGHSVTYWMEDSLANPGSYIITRHFPKGKHLNLDLAAASKDYLAWSETPETDTSTATFQEPREFHDWVNLNERGLYMRRGLKKPVLPDSVRQIYIVCRNTETGDIMKPECARAARDSIYKHIILPVTERFGEKVNMLLLVPCCRANVCFVLFLGDSCRAPRTDA